MVLTRRSLCLALLSALCLMSALATQARPRVDHVFIISFDGGKPAVMQESAMPTLMQMRKEGAGT